MEDWKEIKLGDVCSFQEGYVNPAQTHPEFFDGEIKWLRATDLNNSFVYNTTRTLSKEGFESAGKSALLFKPNTIAISKSGTIGRLGILKDFMCGNRAVINIAPNSTVDYKFIFYVLLNMQSSFEHLAVGSVQKNLYVPILSDIKFKLPPLPTQQKIAAILSSLDDKIELNNKINQNLEQQAQTIFKSWFVDFEPFGGEMPEGWKVGKLSEIAEITMGQSPDGSSYNEDGNGTVFYQGRAEFGTRFPTRRLYTTEPKRIAKTNDVLMSVRAPVGDLNIANEDCCIGRGLAAIRTKENHQSFVYYTMNSLKKDLEVFNGEGTVFGSINQNALNNMNVVIPSKSDMNKFEKIISNLDEQIANLDMENRRLAEIRDGLLPKLMFGEIEV